MDDLFKKRVAFLTGVFLFVLLVAHLIVKLLLPSLNALTRRGFYAVFISNGQVYFGNITKEDEHHLILHGIYYIQSKGGAQGTNDQSDVSLLKLGNELHGPEDEMEINRQQILFIEKLKEDGKVAKAIHAYQQK